MRVGLSLIVEIHIAKGGRSRHLAIVDGDGLAALGIMHHHEAAAAEIACAWERDRESKADGHSGINGIAAILQDLQSDLRGQRFLAGDHAIRAVDGMNEITRAENR